MIRRSARKDAETLMGYFLLPVIWPAVFVLGAFELFSRKFGTGRLPWVFEGVIAWAVCGVFWWLIWPYLA